MTLTIYGVYHSRASRTIWLANELGLPFHHVPVIQFERLPDPPAADALLHTRAPTFLAINPNGHIPSIDDDGLVLHESLAINLYLAKKHGGPLAAADLVEEANLDMWTLWAATEVEPHSLQILIDGDVRRAIATLEHPFRVLDAHLRVNAFMLGARFTVADINVAEIVRYAMSAQELFDAAPHVKAWLATCHARPAFAEMYRRRLAETS